MEIATIILGLLFIWLTKLHFDLRDLVLRQGELLLELSGLEIKKRNATTKVEDAKGKYRV